jgi:hypothetical protein
VITTYKTLTDNQRAFLEAAIGQEVPIAHGERGRITSVSVTSDGFILGRTVPGFDRGVFLGSVPDDASCKEYLAMYAIAKKN